MKRTKGTVGVWLLILLFFYLYVLLKVILFKFNPSITMTFLWHRLQRNAGDVDHIMNRLQLSNFIPFDSISSEIQRLSSHDLIHLGGNVVLFIPLGIFYVLFRKNKGDTWIGVLAPSICLSACLEYLQILFSIGSFDIDDIILNTLGGLCGYGIITYILKSKKQSTQSNGKKTTIGCLG
jgi:glycopeptide antibiotics resistance protein